MCGDDCTLLWLMSIFASNQQVFFTSLLTDQGKARIIIFTSFATMNVNTTIVIGKNYRKFKITVCGKYCTLNNQVSELLQSVTYNEKIQFLQLCFSARLTDDKLTARYIVKEQQRNLQSFKCQTVD